MTRLHGPWTDRQLGRATGRREFKDTLLVAAKSKQCGCTLCAKNGQRGLTDNVMWVRQPDGVYLVAKPVVTL